MSVARALKNTIFISLIVSLAGLIFLLIGLYIKEHYISEIVPEIFRDIGILLISIGLISITYESLLRKQLLEDYNGLIADILDPDARRLGIVHMFENRAERNRKGYLPQALVKGAATEVFCLGLGLINFVPEERELIRQKIRQGCKFKFLIYDTNGADTPALEASLGYSNNSLIRSISTATGAFQDFQTMLLKEGIGRDRFDVRLYKFVPPWGLIAVDRDLDTARIFVEINGRGIEGTACPGFALEKHVNGWYSFFESQLLNIWSDATPLINEEAHLQE